MCASQCTSYEQERQFTGQTVQVKIAITGHLATCSDLQLPKRLASSEDIVWVTVMEIVDFCTGFIC